MSRRRNRHTSRSKSSRGEPRYSSNRRLPPALRSVHRLLRLSSQLTDPVNYLLTRRVFERKYRVRLERGMPRVERLPLSRSPHLRQPEQKIGHKYDPMRILQVQIPQRVKFCVQRKVRRQVLFAQKVAGRSGGSPGPYRRTENSNYKC